MTATPLRAVLDAFAAGARSRHDVCARTGLSRDTVDAAIGHLVRMGRLEATELSVGCPDGGCGSCAAGHGESPGCGASTASAGRRGPVLVSLSLSSQRPPP